MLDLNIKQIRNVINSFQSGVAFHIETSHLFSRAKQMTGFYMKSNTGLKQVNFNHFKIAVRFPQNN